MVIKSRIVFPILAIIMVAALVFFLVISKKTVEKGPKIEKETVRKSTPPPEKKRELPEKVAIAPSYPWAIQVSACPCFTQAKDLTDKLKQKGISAYLTETIVKGGKWYRVRIGFYETKAKAEEVGRAIVKEFNIKDYWVISPAQEEIDEHFEQAPSYMVQ